MYIIFTHIPTFYSQIGSVIDVFTPFSHMIIRTNRLISLLYGKFLVLILLYFMESIVVLIFIE